MTPAAALTVALIVLVPVAPGQTATETCPLFVLRQAGGSLAVQTERLADGETRVMHSNAETGVIDIILPPAPGGSAGLERLADGRLLIARYLDGRLSVTTRLADGKEYARPPRALADLRRCDIRVSVAAHDKTRTAFVIRGYESVAPDDIGPVVDLFAGKVPLADGDYLVTTQTTTRVDAPGELAGEVLLEWMASPRSDGGGYLIAKARRPDGAAADFVVDLAAGQTVVSKSALPHSTQIEPASMIEHSTAGTRELKYTIGGATGEVQNILGFATIPSLDVGDITLRDVRVLVMSSLFSIGDREVNGILGVDVLRRAKRVAFHSARADRPARLVLGADGPAGQTDAIRTPFSSIGDHVFIRGEVAGQPVSFVLDTGSPTSFLDPDAAAATGVVADASGGRTIHGLDGGETVVHPATVDALVIGGRPVRGVSFEIGRLPVLEQVRTGQHVGLIGNSFFARFDRVVIDFEEAVVWFVP